jgi:hypothetical protein
VRINVEIGPLRFEVAFEVADPDPGRGGVRRPGSSRPQRSPASLRTVRSSLS